MRLAIQTLALLTCAAFLFTGCRSSLGGPCKKKNDCALGLYCDLEKEVCDDRGKLLKKQAEEIYVYPIPAATPKGVKSTKPAVVPVP